MTFSNQRYRNILKRIKASVFGTECAQNWDQAQIKQEHPATKKTVDFDIPNVIENLDLRPSQSPGIGRSNLAPISNKGDDSIAPMAGALASVLNQILNDIGYKVKVSDIDSFKKRFWFQFRYKWVLTALISCCTFTGHAEEVSPSNGLPLFYWQETWRGRSFVNFGDYISLKLVERIVNGPLRTYTKAHKDVEKKLLGTGSIISFANDHDIVWGSGINGKLRQSKFYKFNDLDIRCVRGPLTRNFIVEHLHLHCPEIYGDPALLFPYFFPEFTRKENPSMDYLIIPHYSEENDFLKEEWDNVVYSTDPWDEVVGKILDSRFVVSSSLHGIIIAEAYGIPARLLRVSNNEPLFKYQDYYSGTGRPNFSYATTINDALEMGGEPPFQCDLEKIYEVFPFEYWPHINPQLPKLKNN